MESLIFPVDFLTFLFETIVISFSMTRFMNRGDVQTLAMLSCVFREPLYHGLNKSTVSLFFRIYLFTV